MRPSDIHRMDLNLLRVFMALMEEGSVTAAGDRLGWAQSSISHALTRLRTALDLPPLMQYLHETDCKVEVVTTQPHRAASGYDA